MVSQDYGNFEIIVIDGGSTDQTSEVIEKYKSNIAYWVSEADRGQTDALIKGFAKATGPGYFWLCSDDVLMPGVLQRIATIFSDNPSLDFIYGDTEYLYSNGDRVPKPRISYHYETMLRAFNIIAQPSCFFSAEAYRRVGGLDPTLNYAMDYDLFLRFGREARWLQVREPLSLYRIHASSKTVNDRKRFVDEWERCREKVTKRRTCWIDRALWYVYTARVVVRFWVERGQIKIGYDNRKYRGS